MSSFEESGESRRIFLKELAAYGGGIALAGYSAGLGAPASLARQVSSSTVKWAKQMGLELFTVRDVMTDQKSYISTLEKVAEIGYKEIEPAGGYGSLQPNEFRALLDRLGLSMPSTHSGATEGPDLEKQLEGFQIMGMKYTGISAGGSGRGARGGRGAAAAAGGAASSEGNGSVREDPQSTTEQVKRTAAQDNAHGKIAQRFGMKILIHNHTVEFAPLSDNSNMCPYDILLAETDPELVAMQMDIGWASIAGQDVLARFRKYPGRFELWHVKDSAGIPQMTPQMTTGERHSIADLAPVGLGAIDYRTIFQNAELAGLKHFCIEQDNAAAWGDSVAAARVSYDNLVKVLS
jgi:sugar phosphate isomerase/epimerase